MSNRSNGQLTPPTTTATTATPAPVAAAGQQVGPGRFGINAGSLPAGVFHGIKVTQGAKPKGSSL